MTIQQFITLTEMDKVCAIMQSGRLITQRLENETRTFLYRLESFYVFACYSVLNDQLTDITAYIDVDLTTPRIRKFLVSIHPAERQYDTPEI
jgi:hypothetical protein